MRALSKAVEDVYEARLDHVVAGPSNVGNLFASRGVPATCGFGVVHRGVHAPDEAFEIASLRGTLETYVRAVERFLTGSF